MDYAHEVLYDRRRGDRCHRWFAYNCFSRFQDWGPVMLPAKFYMTVVVPIVAIVGLPIAVFHDHAPWTMIGTAGLAG